MKQFDLIIIGGGPGGMSSALYAVRNQLNVLLIDKEYMLGGTVFQTKEVDNYLGYIDSASVQLIENMNSQLKPFIDKGLTINLGEKVMSIRKELNGQFTVMTKNEIGNEELEYSATAVILGTGKSINRLKVDDVEYKIGTIGISYCAVCDGMFYKDENVVVVGGGDSALETAILMSDVGKKVYLVHRRNSYRAKQYLVDRVKETKNIVEIKSAYIKSIKTGKHKLDEVTIEANDGSELQIKASVVMPNIGSTPNILDYQGKEFETIEQNGNSEIFITPKCETTIQGLYAVGDVTNIPHKQVAIAVGHGATASLEAYNYIIKHKK